MHQHMSCRDHVWFQEAEYAFVGVPAVEYGVGVPAEVAGGGGRDSFQEFSVCVPADHDAGLAVPGKKHAQPAGVEVERVGAR